MKKKEKEIRTDNINSSNTFCTRRLIGKLGYKNFRPNWDIKTFMPSSIIAVETVSSRLNSLINYCNLVTGRSFFNALDIKIIHNI